MLNGKAKIILLIGGLMINEYFLEPKYLGTNLKVELDLPYYETILKMQQMLIHRTLLKKLI